MRAATLAAATTPWLGAAILIAGSLDVQTPQAQTFRARTDVVLVHVAVTDGRVPMAGLGAADFAITDNGVVQAVQSVLMDPLPLDVCLVIDTSGSALPVLDRFVADLTSISSKLRTTDRIRVVTFGSEVSIAVPLQAAGAPVVLDSGAIRGGRTALNDAVLYSLVQPADPDRRQIVVTFTDGIDNWSWIHTERLAVLAARSDAVLFFVTAGRPRLLPGNMPNEVKRLLMQRLPGLSVEGITAAARATGGDLYDAGAGSGLVAGFERVLKDFRMAYVLTYLPRGVRRDGWHDLAVKVPKARNAVIRARKGYQGS